MRKLRMAFAGCGGAAVVGAGALLAPCHTVPLALSIGFGLSGASAVAVGLYGCVALGVMSIAACTWALSRRRPWMAVGAAAVGAASLSMAAVQDSMPPQAAVIDVASLGIPYDQAVRMYEDICGGERKRSPQ